VDFILSEVEVFLHQGRKVNNKKMVLFKKEHGYLSSLPLVPRVLPPKGDNP